MGSFRSHLFSLFALLAAVTKGPAGEPVNVPGGVVLPARVVETNVVAGQRITIASRGGAAYFYLQYSKSSSAQDWQNLTVHPVLLNEGVVDQDGAVGRMYRALNTFGAAPTLSIQVSPGEFQPDKISISAPFFQTWSYVLENRPSASPAQPGVWKTVATSKTNASFLVPREIDHEYRLRAIPPIEREDFEPVVVAGQSNAGLSDDLWWGDRADNVLYLSDFISHYAQFLHPARFHGLTGAFVFSFSVQAAIDLSDSNARKYLLIPTAVGGTAMKQWFPSESRFDVSTLFGRANYRRVLGSPKLPAAIWYYGHESSVVPLENYIPDWKLLISEFRKECGPAPLIYAQLAKNSDPASHELARLAADRQRLTEAGAEQEVSGAHMVVTFDLPLADGLHLSAEGQRLLGKRFALAMRQHVYGEMINGTGPRLLDVTQVMAEPNLIVVTFNKPVNDVVNAYENEFRVRSNSAEVPIKSIRRGQNASRIEIEIPRNPGGDLFVEYGVQPSIGNNLFLTNVVRDVDNLPAPVFGPVKVRTL